MEELNFKPTTKDMKNSHMPQKETHLTQATLSSLMTEAQACIKIVSVWLLGDPSVPQGLTLVPTSCVPMEDFPFHLRRFSCWPMALFETMP